MVVQELTRYWNELLTWLNAVRICCRMPKVIAPAAIVGTSSVVAQIDRATGAVSSLADLSELTPAGLATTDVLSGLAYRPSTDTWFVTGKRWDVMYEIALAP